MLQIKNGELKISVRTLVEFLCRSGNIDNRSSFAPDSGAMDAGSRIHKKIQKSKGPDYQAEVSLAFDFTEENYRIRVEGRADGIFIENGLTIVEEIKGTFSDLDYLKEAYEVHKAQAKCYAFFYGVEHGLDRVGILMTYANLDTEITKEFSEIHTMDSLSKWFLGLYTELKKWADYVVEHRDRRDATIEGLKFPFPYREGQRELAVSVFKAIAQERNLFIQAPTGVGKTLSTVYPAVMAIGDKKADKIFYLTAKTITRTAAEEAFSELRKQGLNFTTLTITAKDKICFMDFPEGPECNPVSCPYAKGHNDRVNDAVYDLITHEEIISRGTIEAYALKHQVCPFEFALDVSYWVDGIVCDYNYVFDPHVYLKRFFSEGVKGDYVFLIDEAHNLVDRGREMYSATVYKEDFLTVKKYVGSFSKRLTSALERCNKDLLEFKRQCENTYRIMETDGTFSVSMQRLAEEMIKFFEQHRDFIHRKELLDFYFKVTHYIEMHDCMDENYMIYSEHTEEGFMLRLFCVSPAANLKTRLAKGKGAVFFSATLLPINYYKELLSGNREDYAIYAHSPFDCNKRLLIVGRDVSSRYTRRNLQEFQKIRDYILDMALARTGNYLVFFPSYAFMEQVLACMKDAIEEGQIRALVQHNKMSEEEKEDFLGSFHSGDSHNSLVGMCVMGGIFSEGIDLKADRLIGTVIVGTGIPSISTSQQILRQFFDEKENNGYAYAYVYPGMNKVLQAAGRVIRTQDDRGVIALLDDRFLTTTYQNLFPVEWSNYRVTVKEKVHEEILDFWNDMLYNSVENVFR